MKPDELPSSGKHPDDSVMEDLMEHAGRWVAWTRDRQRILAVADSFADAMTQALAAGEQDPYVNKAPGVSLDAGRKPFVILEDDSPNIIDDVRRLVAAGKTQRWDIVKWAVTINMALAAASVAVKQQHVSAAFFFLAVGVVVIAFFSCGKSHAE